MRSKRQQECRVTASSLAHSPLSLLALRCPISNRRTRLQIGKLFFASFAFFLRSSLASSPFYQRGKAAAEHDIDREELKGRTGE